VKKELLVLSCLHRLIQHNKTGFKRRELNNLLYLPVSDKILLFDVINLTVKFHKSRHVSGSLKVSMTTERSMCARSVGRARAQSSSVTRSGGS